jgi:hypothetical protein
MILIYWDETVDDDMNEYDKKTRFQAYQEFNKKCTEAGVLVGGNALQSTCFATTIRVRNGDTLTTDAPFAQTKKQFGRYFIFDCQHLDEAIDWAKIIPHAKTGAIEIRPLRNV